MTMVSAFNKTRNEVELLLASDPLPEAQDKPTC